LAELERSPPLPRSPKALQDPDLGEDFDRVNEDIANALVQRTRIDAGISDKVQLTVSRAKLGEKELGRAGLPGHDLHVIEEALIAIYVGDTERYLATLAALGRMDAITMPLAIQGAFLEREPATQQRISKATQILHQRLIARGTDAATLELSQQIVEIVKESATPGRATGIDTASEKPVRTIVPPSGNGNAAARTVPLSTIRPKLNGVRPKAAIPPTSPQRNTRSKPALTRKRRRELPRIMPQDGPRNRAAVTPADAMRDAIDQANVLEFLKALHALAQLEVDRRFERYYAIGRALENKPPQMSSVERLNALMVGIDMETQGPVREWFRLIDRGWLMLQRIVPDLKVAFRSSAGQGDLNTALTFLTGLSTARDASPAKSN
jgi:hypothetical protein